MSRIELFLTGVRACGTVDLPDDGFEKIIKDAVAAYACVGVNDVEVCFAENDIIEIKLPLSSSDDAEKVGIRIAALLDSDVATHFEWTDIRMSRVR